MDDDADEVYGRGRKGCEERGSESVASVVDGLGYRYQAEPEDRARP